ncbi:flagellar hook basal-body protein [Photobacterium damselae]|uniref:flagellar hook basal-body protein n=1 Tax=Photobacterium damselae TaxID=38293 RepID=UPI0040675F9F
MDASLYLSMSAMRQNSMNLQSITNNLANANTDGFKSDNVAFKQIYLNGKGSPAIAYTELSSTGIDLTSGALKATGNANDVTVGGNGYFEFTRVDGSKYLSKTATLMLTGKGVLISSTGDAISNQKGKSITLSSNDFMVDKNGNVSEKNGLRYIPIDKIRVISVNPSNVSKDKFGQLEVSGDSKPKQIEFPQIFVGFKESSNVSSVKEMARMVQMQRDYELSSKAFSASKEIQKDSSMIL